MHSQCVSCHEPGSWFPPYELGCLDTPHEPGCWHTPYVDIPVPQIVEEIAETRNPLIKCNSTLNVYFQEIDVFPS